MGSEFSSGEGNEDEGHGGHEEAEDDVPGGFYPRFACGEAVRVDVSDSFVAEDKRDVGQRVEDGVGHCGEQRQGAGCDGAVELQDGKADIRCEGAVHGDFELKLCAVLGFTGFADVFVDGLEEAVDLGVLGFVEGGDSRGWGLPREVHRVAIRRSMALPCCVGSDAIELGLRFEAPAKMKRVSGGGIAGCLRFRVDCGCGAMARDGVSGRLFDRRRFSFAIV